MSEEFAGGPELLLCTARNALHFRDGSEESFLKEVRYFALYCRLALARVANPSGGYLSIAEIRRLRGWEAPTAPSVGKMVARHIQTMRSKGRQLIEFRDFATTGPYRLCYGPNQLQFDKRIEEVDAELLFPARRAYFQTTDESPLFAFVHEMSSADMAQAAADHSRELVHLRRALASAVQPHHKVLALILMGRIFVQRGAHRDVLELHRQVRRELKFAGEYAHWARGRMYEQRALLIYNRGCVEHRPLTEEECASVRKYVQRGLEAVEWQTDSVVTSDLLMILADIECEDGRYGTALRLINRVLDGAVFANNPSAVCHCYEALAHIEEQRGLRQQNKGRTAAATRLFRAASRRAEQAVAVRDGRREDRSDLNPDLLLIKLYRRLGHVRDAIDVGTEALQRARSTGSAHAHRLIATALAHALYDSGDERQAVSLLLRLRETAPGEYQRLSPEWRAFVEDWVKKQA